MYKFIFFSGIAVVILFELGFACTGGGSATAGGRPFSSSGSTFDQVSSPLSGVLDTSINGTGYLIANFATYKFVATRDSSGRTITVGANTNIHVTRYLKGTLTTDPSFSSFVPYLPFPFLEALYVSLDSSDNIYVAAVGYLTDPHYPWAVVNKFRSDGSLDTSYGTSGSSVVRYNQYTGNNNDEYFGMFCGGDGTCFVYGSSSGRLEIAKLSPSGILNTNFANLHGFMFPTPGYGTPWFEHISAISFSSDGNLNLVGGSAIGPYPYTGSPSILWQMDPDFGRLNQTFGFTSGATVTKIFPSADEVYQLITGPTGLYTFGLDGGTYPPSGRYTSNLTVRKFTPQGIVDPSFTPIDLSYINPPGGGTGTTGGMAIDFYNSIIYTSAVSSPNFVGNPSTVTITASDANTGLPMSSFGTNGTLVVDLSSSGYTFGAILQMLFDGNGKLLLFGFAWPNGNPNSQQPAVMVIK
jgi:hypothetical protein